MKRLPTIGMIGVLGYVFASPAFGQLGGFPTQTVPPGSFAHENVSGARSRAPGNLVSAGVARARAANNSGVQGFEITETDNGDPSFWTEFLTRAIPIVFGQINQAIVLFENLLLARAGQPPSIPGGDASGLNLGNLTGAAGG